MHPTTQATQELRQHIHRSMEVLQTLRDEIRVELHLAGMDAKEEWKKIEKRFPAIEGMAGEATHATQKMLADAIVTVRMFREALAAKPAKR